MGALKDSLAYLGLRTDDLSLLVDGVNRLLIDTSGKLNLLARYEREEGIIIPPALYARIK